MREKLLFIYKHYGWKHQLKKLREEQSEVREAIRRYEWVKRVSNNKMRIESFKKEIEQEIADNFVLLGQFIEAEDMDREYIKAIMEFKVKRTIDEMGKERKGR